MPRIISIVRCRHEKAMKKGRDLVCQTPGLSALSYTFFLIRLILPACREGLK
jgi:hypothetical protein